jgi:hypothetical protein
MGITHSTRECAKTVSKLRKYRYRLNLDTGIFYVTLMLREL